MSAAAHTLRRALVLGLALAAGGGCFFDPSNSGRFGGDDTGDGDTDQRDGGQVDDADASVPVDGGEDASEPDADSCAGLALSFEGDNLPACLEAVGPALTIDSDDELDTDTGLIDDGDPVLTTQVVPQEGGPPLLVVVAESITIAPAGTLRVVGSRPVVLVSAADLDVEGELLVDGEGPVPGAGGDVDCGTSAGSPGELQGDDDDEGGSGAGGGGFATAGGAGAIVNGSDGDPIAGGTAAPGAGLVPLRGGCPGGTGGQLGGDGGGPPGAGGGAVELVAVGTLRVSGVINAGGGGGGGAAQPSHGGGGGGSGGGVLAIATDVVVSGVIAANGGGGGEGARGAFGLPGSGGTADADAAAGGNSLSSGGNGGSGATGADDGGEGLEGNSNDTPAGGGGGGGGVGRIVLRAIGGELQISGIVSPPAAP